MDFKKKFTKIAPHYSNQTFMRTLTKRNIIYNINRSKTISASVKKIIIIDNYTKIVSNNYFISTVLNFLLP